MKSPRPGGTENISVSMPSELLGALRSRTGKRGVSAYVTAAVRHQLAMDGLAEIVAAYEAEHEPLSEAEVQAAQNELFGDAPAPYGSNDSAA
jgi:predicted Zn-dependent peptidase